MTIVMSYKQFANNVKYMILGTPYIYNIVAIQQNCVFVNVYFIFYCSKHWLNILWKLINKLSFEAKHNLNVFYYFIKLEKIILS